jgi:hypothetical protein
MEMEMEMELDRIGEEEDGINRRKNSEKLAEE